MSSRMLRYEPDESQVDSNLRYARTDEEELAMGIGEHDDNNYRGN